MADTAYDPHQLRQAIADKGAVAMTLTIPRAPSNTRSTSQPRSPWAFTLETLAFSDGARPIELIF